MLVSEAVLRIDQNSMIYLTDVATDDQKPSVLDLARGAFQSFSRRPHALEVNTPYLNAAVQGTEFVIRAEAGKTTLTTFEGVVRVSNQSGSTSVGSGQSVSAGAGRRRVHSYWSGPGTRFSGASITRRFSRLGKPVV